MPNIVSDYKDGASTTYANAGIKYAPQPNVAQQLAAMMQSEYAQPRPQPQAPVVQPQQAQNPLGGGGNRPAAARPVVQQERPAQNPLTFGQGRPSRTVWVRNIQGAGYVPMTERLDHYVPGAVYGGTEYD